MSLKEYWASAPPLCSLAVTDKAVFSPLCALHVVCAASRTSVLTNYRLRALKLCQTKLFLCWIGCLRYFVTVADGWLRHVPFLGLFCSRSTDVRDQVGFQTHSGEPRVRTKKAKASQHRVDVNSTGCWPKQGTGVLDHTGEDGPPSITHLKNTYSSLLPLSPSDCDWKDVCQSYAFYHVKALWNEYVCCQVLKDLDLKSRDCLFWCCRLGTCCRAPQEAVKKV